MLGALGLTDSEESVYRLVLSTAGMTIGQLAADFADAGSVVATLAAHGLVTRSDDLVVPAPPAVALGALISQRRDDLRMAELALASLAELHRAAVADYSLGDLVEVVSGVDAIRHRFLQIQYAAREQVRNFVTHPYAVVPPGENTAEDVLVDRGVKFRVVIERAALEVPGMLDEIVDSLQRGVQVRVAESLPIKLVLADAELGLVPLANSPGGEPGAVLLQRSGLLAGMEALFEAYWQRAYPLDLASLVDGESDPGLGSGELVPLDRKIISLLLAGLTDQAVAMQLDISMRTLQRRMRHLLDVASVETRLQLGHHAARAGWA